MATPIGIAVATRQAASGYALRVSPRRRTYTTSWDINGARVAFSGKDLRRAVDANVLAREIGMHAIGAACPLLAKKAVAHCHRLRFARCGDRNLAAGTTARVHDHRRLPEQLPISRCQRFAAIRSPRCERRSTSNPAIVVRCGAGSDAHQPPTGERGEMARRCSRICYSCSHSRPEAPKANVCFAAAA